MEDKIDDILASLDDDNDTGEGFNRNYFQSKAKDNSPKKKHQPQPFGEYKKEVHQKSQEYYQENPQPKVDVDLDWEKDDFDDNELKHFSNKKVTTFSSSSQPVDIRNLTNNSKKNKRYCDVVYLGNGNSYTKNLCDNLICTKCDVKVSQFKNNKWDDSVNYLFFRNNYSNRARLETKLLPLPNATSYSCQCTWKTIPDEYIIASKVSNWVCCGHDI